MEMEELAINTFTYCRDTTLTDSDYETKLKALQVEQAGLNRRIKVQRERSQAITAEFYALKDEWRNARASSL